jgi:hypothetical protein
MIYFITYFFEAVLNYPIFLSDYFFILYFYFFLLYFEINCFLVYHYRCCSINFLYFVASFMNKFNCCYLVIYLYFNYYNFMIQKLKLLSLMIFVINFYNFPSYFFKLFHLKNYFFKATYFTYSLYFYLYLYAIHFICFHLTFCSRLKPLLLVFDIKFFDFFLFLIVTYLILPI